MHGIGNDFVIIDQRTDPFELTPELIGAPIALGSERERQDEAAVYYAELAASGLAPVPEKSVSAKKA